jgi:hypothetical protein
MTILNELLDRLSSSKEEYERLYESDNLYIVWAKKENDTMIDNFIKSIDNEYFHWTNNLKGKSARTAQLENTDNCNEILQGHIYSVTNSQMSLFEKVALMPSMKYGCRFDKYNINDLKEKEKQEILETLKQDDK